MSLAEPRDTTPPSNPTAPPAPPAATKPDSADRPRRKPRPQGLFCLWHGIEAPNWVRLLLSRPKISWSRLPMIASVSAVSLLNSWHSLLEAIVYTRRIQQTKITYPPIFILGHWRSGTTLLHNLLTLDKRFTFPNLYQVMYPNHFLLTERVASALTARFLPKTRPMDNVPAGWQLPQEDEVALLMMTLMSPYLMVAFQGERPRYGRFFSLEQLTPAERTLWIDSFLYFLKKLTIRADKPIILKSPSHTYRIPLLLELFPQAKFIYIYRNPYDVYKSTLHLRRTMFTENGLMEATEENLREDSLETYRDCIETYERTKQLIPPGHLHPVKYEDFESDPVSHLRQIYEGLNLGDWAAAEPAIQREVAKNADYRKNSFAVDEAEQQMVYDRLRFAFDLYGYTPNLQRSAPAA